MRGYVRTFHKFTGGLSQNQVLRLYKPWFVGPQGYRVDPYEANEFNSSSRQAGGSTTRTLMSPVDDTLCYFTSLSGDFRGGGERAQIVPYANGATTVWALETKSGDGRVYARARCIAFDLPMLLQGNF